MAKQLHIIHSPFIQLYTNVKSKNKTFKNKESFKNYQV